HKSAVGGPKRPERQHQPPLNSQDLLPAETLIFPQPEKATCQAHQRRSADEAKQDGTKERESRPPFVARALVISAVQPGAGRAGRDGDDQIEERARICLVRWVVEIEDKESVAVRGQKSTQRADER